MPEASSYLPLFGRARAASGFARPFTLKTYPTRDDARLSDIDHRMHQIFGRLTGRIGLLRRARLKQILRRACKREDAIKALGADTAATAADEAEKPT